MRTWNLRQSVNLSIALSFIGLLIVFPFQQTFVGGLFFAAFCAATIGGLADSFAVSALFGQPLKVRWPNWLGTNIIARNRDRLIDELVDMVEHELLSTEMIIKQLKGYDAATVIVHYVESNEGKQAIKGLLRQLLTDLLKVSNPAVFSLSLNRLINQGLQHSKLTPIIQQFITWSVKEKYDHMLISAVSKQLRKLLEKPGVKQFLHEFIATALRSYEQNKKGRQFVNGVAGLNADELTEKLLKIADDLLLAIQDHDHPLQLKLQQYIVGFSNRLQEDEVYAADISRKIEVLFEKLTASLLTTDTISNFLMQLRDQLDQSEYEHEEGVLASWLDSKVDELLSSLRFRQELLEQFNHYVRSALMQFVERNHTYVGQLVRTKLEQFDVEQLIALVQEKTAKDLQYIRLNGTAVGSLIGVLLYLIQYSLGGVLS
ncbi:DUF445 domain-containing protein [Paenibacillus endoradicis]|uniref:DUF445 domain-containing protein n=1 Tax=Paenibacillus endoradicis TaxID=2972487 RepID=UPI00215923F2|nr:DUF445 domain-containing protein [Paenibacillus endoradicis]MCR8655806.1 DUF445 domain-containing protein [Paenibacillus endoradicis]MCR8658132.1 DUF445 domain-containing protein [Paenibacillus endoradicis]